jgi:hypothetical protein
LFVQQLIFQRVTNFLEFNAAGRGVDLRIQFLVRKAQKYLCFKDCASGKENEKH